MPVELQHQQRRAGSLAREVLDVGIRPALEIRDVDHVQVGVRTGQARGFQDLAAGGPEHVLVQAGHGLAAGDQEIQRNHVGAIAVAQFARNIAIHAAIVDVVAAAGQHQPGLAGLLQNFERAAAGSEQAALKFALRGVGGIHGAVAGAAGHAERLYAFGHGLLHLRRTELEMQRGDQEFGLMRFERGRHAQDPWQRLVPGTVVRGAGASSSASASAMLGTRM